MHFEWIVFSHTILYHHLEKCWFTESAGLPNVDTFHYTTLKKIIVLVKITPHLISKVQKYWEAVKLLVADTRFPKFQFSLEISNFITGKNTVSCFPRSDRLTSFLFEKMSSKYPGLKSPSMSVSHSLKAEWRFQEEVACSAQNRNYCMSAFP